MVGADPDYKRPALAAWDAVFPDAVASHYVLREIFGRPVTLVGKEGPKVDVLCCSVSFVYASSFACLLACLATAPSFTHEKYDASSIPVMSM